MSKQDQGLKRLLSPESVNITQAKVVDKRRRHGSIEIAIDTMEPPGKEGNKAPPSLSDLMRNMGTILKHLDSTAKKDDLNELATKSDKGVR